MVNLVTIMDEKIKQLFKNKNVAVTGGLGSIGFEIVKELLEYEVCSVTVVDNRETELAYGMYNSSDERLKFHFCDIRDRSRIFGILKDVNVVFHAAALKHVTVCEFNPFEAVKTNVIGTQNVIEACLRDGVEKMILISTDKAVNPTNVMGATKLLAERLVSAVCNRRNDSTAKFGVVRFGNVLHSRGSVLEIWNQQLREDKKITITDPGMTRFFMDVSQCVYLIFEATRYAEGGETFILKMPSVKIGALAEVYLKLRDHPKDDLVLIGKRPGEKIHEELVFPEEYEMLLENDKFLLRLPFFSKIDAEKRYRSGFKKAAGTKYSSNDPCNLLNKEQIKSTLSRFLELD
jgi:UDP-N-acetylglucosamine 4,6-dehydratase